MSTSLKGGWRKVLALLLFAGVYLYVAYRFGPGILEAWKTLPPKGLGLAALGFILLVWVQIGLSALSNQSLFGAYLNPGGMRISLNMVLAGFLGNLLPFSLGLVARGWYAHQKSRLEPGLYVYLTVIQLAAVMSASGVVLIPLCVELRWLWIPAVLLVSLSLIAWLPWWRALPRQWLRRLSIERSQGLRKHAQIRLPYQIGIQVAALGVNSLRLAILFHLMGVSLPWAELLALHTLANLLRYAAVTPAGLGPSELLAAGVGGLFGHSTGLLFLGISTCRIFDILVAALPAPWILSLDAGGRR